MAGRGACTAAGKPPTIGYLGSGAPTSQRTWVAVFVQRLIELGWVEGRTVAIEYRWAEGISARLSEIAAEFVRLKVDVILAVGTEATLAAKQAAGSYPDHLPVAGDPVGSGLVASLSRPGGNVTGLSNLVSDLGAKRLEILREVFPGQAGWRSLPTPPIRVARWRLKTFRPRLARSLSRSFH